MAGFEPQMKHATIPELRARSEAIANEEDPCAPCGASSLDHEMWFHSTWIAGATANKATTAAIGSCKMMFATVHFALSQWRNKFQCQVSSTCVVILFLDADNRTSIENDKGAILLQLETATTGSTPTPYMPRERCHVALAANNCEFSMEDADATV
jgi:hypothetical protein